MTTTTEILAAKSRELLNDQLSAFDSNNSKAGIFISISALFVPITFSIFEKFATSTLWIIIFFTPIVLNLAGIYFLIRAVYPKILFNGINFDEFDRLVNEEPESIEMFEIAINRDSFQDNATVLTKQNKYLKQGLRYIFVSTIVLTVVFFVNLTITKCSNMSDNNQNSNTSSGNSGSQNAGSNNPNTSRQIPSTNPGQRSTIEKGGNPKGDILKK